MTAILDRFRRLVVPDTVFPDTRRFFDRSMVVARAGRCCRAGGDGVGLMWCQHEISLPAFPRGCHLITDYVRRGCPEIGELSVGLLHVFICHTSASLTINENADPDVLQDLGMAFDRLSPETWPWTHTCEGPDDMPAHVKSSLTDSSISVPVRDGRLVTGTWQGIYLCEHRNRGGSRRLILTLQGERQASGGT